MIEEIIYHSSSKSQIRPKHNGSQAAEQSVYCQAYFGRHNFPCLIPAAKRSICSFFSLPIHCCVVMARQTDGAFSDSGFDPSEYSVSPLFFFLSFHILVDGGDAVPMRLFVYVSLLGMK